MERRSARRSRKAMVARAVAQRHTGENVFVTCVSVIADRCTFRPSLTANAAALAPSTARTSSVVPVRGAKAGRL